jgi:hypothetical protein
MDVWKGESPLPTITPLVPPGMKQRNASAQVIVIKWLMLTPLAARFPFPDSQSARGSLPNIREKLDGFA